MNYWAIVNDVKVGPLSEEQLKACGLTAETIVWREGLAQWVAAGTLPEFSSYFAAGAAWARYATGVSETPRLDEPKPLPPCPSTYMAWAIIATILCCIPFGVPAIIYAGQVTTKYNQGDYEGAKRSSDRAAIWLIIAVVAGLISIPFQIALL